MTLKIQYEDQEQRQEIIESNADKVLIGEENLFTGNFLIFTDTLPVEQKITVIDSIKSPDLVELQNQNLDIMQGIADLWLVVDSLRGGVSNG